MPILPLLHVQRLSYTLQSTVDGRIGQGIIFYKEFIITSFSVNTSPFYFERVVKESRKNVHEQEDVG